MRVGWFLKKSQEFSGLGKPSKPSSISSQPCNHASVVRSGDAGWRCRSREGCLHGRPPCATHDRPPAASSIVDNPSSKFQIMPSQTHNLHKLLRAAKFTYACRLPMFVLPLSITTPIFVSLPFDKFSCLAWTVQCQAHVRQTICSADFPWQTYNCTNLRCRFFPLLAWLPLPQCRNQQSFLSSLGLSSPSRLIVSTCCLSYQLYRFRRHCRFQHCPPCLNQHYFVSVSPGKFNPVIVGL